jgi:hypothetical protein
MASSTGNDISSRKPPSAWYERAIQITTLLIGGGLGGILATVLSNAVEWRKVENQAEVNNLGFVDKYLSFVIDKDIHSRIRIAEYFKFVLADEAHRRRWENYLKEINDKRLHLTVTTFSSL